MNTVSKTSNGFLKEDQVAKYFMPYLKEFYRYRYEFLPGSLDSNTDLVSADGIKADGILTFNKEDGTPFTCAFEATGREVIDEVKYKKNDAYFIWDCMAFALLMTAICYAAFFVFNPVFLKNLAWIGNFGFITGSLLFFFSVWYFLFQGWKKYRYIYAIEQFKRYHADEQWVAIAADVFPGRKDPYLKELKNQCMYNGFGLVVVDSDGNVNPVATPSRLGPYGRNRKMRQWITDTEFYKGTMEVAQISTKFQEKLPNGPMKYFKLAWRPFNYLLVQPIKKGFFKVFIKPFKRDSGIFGKYMRSYSYQKYITGGAFIALALMAWKSISWKSVDYLNEEKYRQELSQRKSIINPEHQPGYVYDGTPWYMQDGVPRQNPYELADARQSHAAISSKKRQVMERPVVYASVKPKKIPKAKKTPTKIPPQKSNTTSKGIAPVTYNASILDGACNPLINKMGWIVQDNYFMDVKHAQARKAALQGKGIKAIIVPKTCIEPCTKGYWVFAGKVNTNRKQAEGALKLHKTALKKHNLVQGKVFLKGIGL